MSRGCCSVEQYARAHRRQDRALRLIAGALALASLALAVISA